MSEEVFSESLAYNDVKKRAVASRSFRTKLPSSNSTSFTENQTIVIRLPGNLAGQYYDFSAMYLKLKVAAAADCNLDRNGAYNFIQRLQISQAGAQICDINNYNVLVCAMMDHQASHGWKASSGANLLGLRGDSLSGVKIGNGTTRTFCIPMVCNPLSNTTPHRLIPAFSLSDIEIRFTLNSNAAAVYSAGAPALAYSDVEMVCMMTELSPGAQAMVDQNTGGIYSILANSFMNSTATRAGATNVTANLGFSVSSLERIIVVNRLDASINTQARYEQSRARSGLTQYSFLINSEIYPQRPVNIDDQGAEAWAELLISDHSLVDFSKASVINSGFTPVGTVFVGTSDLTGNAPDVPKATPYVAGAPTGTSPGAAAVYNNAGAAATASTIGTFLIGCDFESMIANGKSHRIYSGVSTLASNVQFRGTYSGGDAAGASSLDFFAIYTIRMTLNTRGLGVFEVSV
jgi:hypothetical protein